jgi:pyrroloquinoline quinone (PQQ) biosynthesis protein C
MNTKHTNTTRRVKTFRQVIESDIERYIKEEAKRLAKENGWDKIHALSFLRTNYEGDNRVEEAAIVTKVISKEEANEIRKYDDD